MASRPNLPYSYSCSPTPSPASTFPSTPPESFDREEKSTTSKLRQGAYSKWRPSYHLVPQSGWLNDPCAPGYDPNTGLYHISFQWNPDSADWGNISWGHATSKDMVNWKLDARPILEPDTEYDDQGVFTGCLIPHIVGDAALTVAYTSVSSLPIHHTLPHLQGCESLSLASSVDGGTTWQKAPNNPVLPREPKELDVTGWRDPFVAPWPTLARSLHLDSRSTLFAIISGGIRDVTPTTFLYAIGDNQNLSQWDYIGPLVNCGLNNRTSRWSGDLGKNWEVTNFMTLSDSDGPGVQREFLVMGTEGCLPHAQDARAADEDTAISEQLSRPLRQQLWMSGPLQEHSANIGTGSDQSESKFQMIHNFGGHLDHGCFYAANSFFDPLSQSQIVWGWITEDDLCDDLRQAQGWSGMLSLPRELMIQTLHHVIGASISELDTITSIEHEQDTHGSFTIRTLASQPAQRVVQVLRSGPGVRCSSLREVQLQNLSQDSIFMGFTSNDVQTNRWELDCSFEVSKLCRTIGLRMFHCQDKHTAHSTTLSFSPSSETFNITRPSLPSFASPKLINSRPETAPHTLFNIRDPTTTEVKQESLSIRAYRDNSVLEVFVNDRTAISTRLYAADETFGMCFFADDGDRGWSDGSALLNATLWDGLCTL